MSRRTETCVVWTCDDCNDEYGEDDGTIHLTADETPTGWETIDGTWLAELLAEVDRLTRFVTED